MLKEAIEKIQELAQPIIHEQNGKSFCIRKDGIQQIFPEKNTPDTLDLYSLDSLVKMIKTEAVKSYKPPIYVTIPTHLKAICFAQPLGDTKRYQRPEMYAAHATNIPGWEECVQLPFEEMQIALRTQFQETADTNYALKLLSDITTGAKITFNDNGIATSVVTQKGISLQSNEAIRPIVKLKPYRTFQEVEQPESTFLIRISERGIRFVEADGGMWKLQARNNLKGYLEEALAAEISAGDVVVAL